MCLPLVALGVAAAGAVAQYESQAQAAEAQGKFQNAMYGQTQDAASKNYNQQIGSMSLRIGQETDLASQQAQANSVAALESKGASAVSSGESNVSGNSVNELFHQFGAIQSLNHSVLQSNLVGKQKQGQDELLGVRSGAISRISDRTPAPVALPSMLATGLQIGGAALSSYDLYQRQAGTGPYAPSRNSTKT